MSMPTVEEISAVLGEIQDPELHRGLNELNMVRDIRLDGSHVGVLIALTIPGCPLKSYFTDVVPAKLRERFPAIAGVTVDLTSMTEEERQALVGGLRKETPSPFARADSSTQVIAVGSGKGSPRLLQGSVTPWGCSTPTSGASRYLGCSGCTNGRPSSAT
jgi:ATP-binding protein involved in chromosome partitioning